jgi:uncharacterized repeat protein (TIGR03803 family)
MKGVYYKEGSMRTLRTCGRLSFVRAQMIVFLLCVAMAIPAAAQFTSLVSFNGTSGIGPEYGPLVQGRDGNFYGTTSLGGANNDLCAGCGGTVFQITPTGALTTLYSFCSQTMACVDGASPTAGLVLGTDGNFYGTAYGGGNLGCGGGSGCGTVFRITPAGALTTLHAFTASEGGFPAAGLVLGTNGNFYGTTTTGTVFEITRSGTLATLHFFEGTDGSLPYAGLALGTDGNFYGTTYSGGNAGFGTVFKISPAGKLTTLHSFNLTDGANPVGGLVQAANGNFYGTTAAGGANQASGCGAGSDVGCGTVFEITPSGTLTTLYNFCFQANCTDGTTPYGTLVQATDGNLYGTTYLGGKCCGALFSMTPNGAVTTLYDLCDQHAGCPVAELDGFAPFAGLLQTTSGTFYGTTYYGGTSSNCPYGCGTVFSLSNGLGSFVEPVTYSGKVGATIEFLGQDFSKSSTVSFNGTSATRSVKSGTYLTAVVPSGATTGFVTITTPIGSLQSNKVFRVNPQIKSFTPTSGPVGASVVIAGESFTGDATVTFGGIQATSLTVNSYTQITATVPTGAKTGKIAITTSGGTATSSGKFTVAP